MSLKDWSDNHWLQRHTTSRQEIKSLTDIVDRDIKDASGPISNDWQFGIAYNAALKLCTILLYAEGYMVPKGAMQHYRTITAVENVLGKGKKKDVEYLDACRSKRHETEYNRAGTISGNEAQELIDFVKSFKTEVLNWLKKKHPEVL